METIIGLEKGQTEENIIVITDATLGKGTLLDEIQRLKDELKNLQQKKIGF